ncbi:hypothetical protein, partial [Thermus tenuipuniceus]|uniref:hypothetical protein n=1 Tax=Thermus tenuipuniceus TaxID=2078690 RepID=UPI001ABF5F31
MVKDASAIGVSLTAYPVYTSLGYAYAPKGGALRGEVEPGEARFQLSRKAVGRLRGYLLEAALDGNIIEIKGARALLEGGVTLDLGEWLSLEANPRRESLVGEVLGDRVRVTGRWTGAGLFLSRVEAYRLSEANTPGARPMASLRNPSGNTFTLTLDRPAECRNPAAPPEAKRVVVVGEARLSGFPLLSVGWVRFGVVDLCQTVTLDVPALRAFEGETARGTGRVGYAGEGSLTVSLVGTEVQVSPSSVSLGDGQSQGFQVSYRCTEEGSFVGRVRAEREGQILAEAPAVVTCLPDEDDNPNNNPQDPDRRVNRIVRFFGDPHLITPDGAAYDFHAQGEFWGNESPEMPFQLQFLSMPGNPDATYTSRLAARLGDVRVEVYPLMRAHWGEADNFLPQVPLGLVVEGQDRTAELSERGYLALPGDAYVAVNRWGNLFVNNRLTDRRPLEVALVFPGGNPRPALVVVGDSLNGGQVRMLGVGSVRPGALAGRLRGMMGNANGNPADDFQTRQGGRLTPPLSFGVLYEVFGRSWEVAAGERLFTGPRPDTRYPAGPPVLDPERLRAAEAFCNPIQDEYLRRACLLDAAVSGDASGAARIAGEVAQGRQGGGGTAQPATQGARLGMSPTVVRLGATGEAGVVLANPTAQGVEYRLRLVGEGPGVRVDGSPLLPGQATEWTTLGGGSSRSLRLAGVCPAGQAGPFHYLLTVEERGAAESRSALVEVSCQVGLTMRLLTPEVEVLRGGQTEIRLALRPLNLQERAHVALSLLEQGSPAQGLTLEPDRLTVEGSAEQTFTVRLRAAGDAATGERLLTLVASLSGVQEEASLRVRVRNPFVWTGAGNGWAMNDCRNWAGGVCPGPRDTAEIVNPTGTRWNITMNLPELAGLTVRGAVSLHGGPLRVQSGGLLEEGVELRGQLQVGAGGVLRVSGLTVSGTLGVLREGDAEGWVVFSGENRFLSGVLLGPGSMRNEGVLRIGPSGS